MLAFWVSAVYSCGLLESSSIQTGDNYCTLDTGSTQLAFCLDILARPQLPFKTANWSREGTVSQPSEKSRGQEPKWASRCQH